MPESTAEKLQESQEVLDRMRRLSDLVIHAEADVLKVNSADQLKKVLFEVAFFALAHDNLVPVLTRLQDRDVEEVEEDSENLVEQKQIYDELLQGDWIRIKEYVYNQLIIGETLTQADRFGLDKEFKYKGVNIFLNEVGNPPKEFGQGQEDYIREKLSLIPDNTEPYVHPDLEELKRSVEISS